MSSHKPQPKWLPLHLHGRVLVLQKLPIFDSSRCVRRKCVSVFSLTCPIPASERSPVFLSSVYWNPNPLWFASADSERRGRAASSTSKSVGVLYFFGKDKSGSAKPPRRLSIPAKSSATSVSKLAGTITPISETRTRRSANGQGRSETPISDISNTSSRVKSKLLTSASYWLNQIKLSESTAKHTISLGFFRLALEAGCEPLQQMQEGLKYYGSRHQLADHEQTVKELFESYNISEDTTQSQVSETISQVPEEGTRSSDDDVHGSSTMETRKLEPKCLNVNSTQLTPATESTKKGTRLRGNFSTNSKNPSPALDIGKFRTMRKSEKPSKQELSKEKGMVKR